MKHPIQITFDAADPARVAQFWAAALGYRIDPPPPGFDSWPEFLAANNVPREQWTSASAVSDPEGVGPRIFVQQVPEPKQVKNRMHLDLHASGGHGVELEERKRKVQAEADRLVQLGATRIEEVYGTFGEYTIVLQDPEGNEFCVD